MISRILCVGGPFAGEHIAETNLPERYCRRWFNCMDLFVYEDVGLEEDIIKRLVYGYEQHCKAVAERNKHSDMHVGANANESRVCDQYTASFLRSCKTVIIPSPIGEAQPLTLTYGKSYIGHLNDSMEFVMPLLVIEDESVHATSEKNLGRIGTPIVILP